MADSEYAIAFADPQLKQREISDEQWRNVLECSVRPRRVQAVAAIEPAEQLAFQLVG